MIARHSKAKTQEINCAIQNLPKHETRKNFPAEIERLLESLLLIFDIAHDNAISIIENDRCRTRKMILEDVQFLEDQRSCRKMELGGLDKTHFAKKRRQEKASTKINVSTSLELDEVGSLDSRDSDSLDADADTEPYSLEDPDFVFPSTSSGATGSKRLRSKNRSPSIALKLPRNPFTSKIVSNMGDRLNLSAGQRTAFMGAIITEVGIPIEKATFSIKSTWTAGKEVRKSSAQAITATFTAPMHATLHWDGKLVPVFKKRNGFGIWYARRSGRQSSWYPSNCKHNWGRTCKNYVFPCKRVEDFR
ncbi:hypothetical protein AVEN_77242-1 [Araneus ventricosus]|uniref:Uncharacterized protein n=1 Tax=Araneus ventricosus TaxID=182803 RepID=A0A4Y2H182_ARAVE|nr:hypothetical protein AVEN_255114-1 [Araneus ventricosus]GBM58716.1 hypothetical protein AVEN_254960-1 [Araneus ventricosus]GBM58761.1 hypothetical protein AVEN_188649-1 [Araneus ventricosus]GBM58804.1 hypothetical protein AVEN_77242-1 [Araneus ventricosus]